MCKFGMVYSDEPQVDANGDKFSKGRLFLGGESEIVLSDHHLWSASDYLMHWKLSASDMLNRNIPTLFCSSLSVNSIDLWIGLPGLSHVIFYNRISKSDDIYASEMRIHPHGSFLDFLGEPTSEWSSWAVPLGYIRCFVDRSK